MAYGEEETKNLALIDRYFTAFNAGAMEGAFEDLFSPEVIQEEFPNQILPHGARRDLAALREASARGRKLMADQRFEVASTYAAGPVVIVESIWTGTVAVDAGPFTAGMALRARFAQFFTLAEGRIVSIRNYDCFDPWQPEGG